MSVIVNVLRKRQFPISFVRLKIIRSTQPTWIFSAIRRGWKPHLQYMGGWWLVVGGWQSAVNGEVESGTSGHKKGEARGPRLLYYGHRKPLKNVGIRRSLLQKRYFQRNIGEARGHRLTVRRSLLQKRYFQRNIGEARGHRLTVLLMLLYYHMTVPPVLMSCPVMVAASSEARKTANEAASSDPEPLSL